jgi:hypothetical protein
MNCIELTTCKNNITIVNHYTGGTSALANTSIVNSHMGIKITNTIEKPYLRN